ncbi:MAG: S8 family serine peptidase [Pirellulales bacterium]
MNQHLARRFGRSLEWILSDTSASRRSRRMQRRSRRAGFTRSFEQLENRVLLHGSADDHPLDSTPAEVNQATADKGAEHFRGEILVGFDGEVVEAHRNHGVQRAMEVARGLVGRFGLSGGSSLFLAPGLAGQAARLVTHWSLPASADVFEVIGQLAGRPGIAYAEPNGMMSIHSHGDPLSPSDPGFTNPAGWPFGVQEHLFPQIRAEEAWDVSMGDTSTADKVVVAVVDTGIDLDHPDLNGNLVAGTTIVKGSTKLGKDDNGHGTHVAGIIAAEINNMTDRAFEADGDTAWNGGIVGVAPEAKIMPVKVLSANGSGSWNDIAKGITFAADNGADIINMSLGGGFSQTVSDAILYAYKTKDVLVISSAGNSNAESSGHPAADLYSLSIAAVDKNDVRASFSNYGFTVDVAAPGVNTLSTFIDVDDAGESGGLVGAYGRISGTSMAAPGAAGVAALIQAKTPSWSAAQVASQLLATADNIDSVNPNFTGKLGAGRIDAAAAVGAEVATPVVIAISGIGAPGGTLSRLELGQTVSVQFSHVMNATSVSTVGNYELLYSGANGVFDGVDDVLIPLTTPSGYQAFPGRGVQMTVNENAPDGNYRFRVLSATGAAEYTRTFAVAPRAVTNFAAVEPLGSLVYQAKVADAFNSAGDIDRFTVELDGSPEQVVSVQVNPAAGATITLTHDAVDETTNPIDANGSDPLPAGTLTIEVSSATAGNYSLDVLLNAVRDSGAAVQNLDTTFVTLDNGAKTADRAAVIGSIGSYIPGAVLDDFEDMNKDEYIELSNGKDRGSNAFVTEAAAHDGQYGLEDRINYGLGGWIYRDDATVHVQQGDTISVWIRSAGGPTGRGYFGFGATSTGTYSLQMAPNTGQLILGKNPGYKYEDLAVAPQSWQANKWYRFVVDWQTDGDIIGRLYDSDGTTLLNTVAANDTSITGGGIAFRSFDSTKHFDTVQKFTLDTSPDTYSFTLAADEAATLVATRLAGPAPTIEVSSDDGTNWTAGSVIPAGTGGTYLVKVTGQIGTEYSLQVLRSAVFEAETAGNDLPATAQDLTQQVALGAIRPIIVGYYTDFNPNSTRPATPIVEAGYVARQITNISTFDLSTIDVLTIYEQNNTAVSQALLDALPAIESWVRGGGRLTVHDRFVSAGSASSNPLIVGRPDIQVTRDFTADIDVLNPNTLVTNGPGGIVDDTTLDGGNSSSHGYAVNPVGTTQILSFGPMPTANVSSFSYTLDEITPNSATPPGLVYYSTIPLDFYLGGATNFRTIYAPNTVEYAAEDIPEDADWYSVTVTDGHVITVETRTPSDGPHQFINNLNPTLYASSGALIASGTPLSDGRNESITISTAGTWLIRVTGEARTVGEYILVQSVTPAPPPAPEASIESSPGNDFSSVAAADSDGGITLDIRLAVDWLLANEEELAMLPWRKAIRHAT